MGTAINKQSSAVISVVIKEGKIVTLLSPNRNFPNSKEGEENQAGSPFPSRKVGRITNTESTKRTEKYSERHEVYFSKAYRQKSVNDGLIVFLPREIHRGTNGVHGKNGDKLNRKLKRLAEKAWTSYYKKTKEEFIKEYGKAN